MTVLSRLLLSTIFLLPACISYEVARLKVNSTLAPDTEVLLEAGKTSLEEVVRLLGAPDAIDFRWNDAGERLTRIVYFYQKQNSSEVVVNVPLEEISKFNTGVQVINLAAEARERETILPNEFNVNSAETIRSRSSAMHKLSEKRSAMTGRAPRLSDLRSFEVTDTQLAESELSPFTPLILKGDRKGLDVLRLEFDTHDILVFVERRGGAPETDVGTQMREALLQ